MEETEERKQESATTVGEWKSSVGSKGSKCSPFDAGNLDGNKK